MLSTHSHIAHTLIIDNCKTAVTNFGFYRLACTLFSLKSETETPPHNYCSFHNGNLFRITLRLSNILKIRPCSFGIIFSSVQFSSVSRSPKEQGLSLPILGLSMVILISSNDSLKRLKQRRSIILNQKKSIPTQLIRHLLKLRKDN